MDFTAYLAISRHTVRNMSFATKSWNVGLLVSINPTTFA